MKKLVVTAPTSVVGSNFIKYLKNKGKQFEIITVGRRESDIDFDFVKNECFFLPCRPDSIIHFAGVLHAENDTEILDMIRANVLGVLKVCISAKENGANYVIFVSSINATIDKTSTYYNFYSLSKKQAEEMARLYCKKNNIALCIIY